MKANESVKHHGAMKELPPQERPYEKYYHSGVSALSDAELLAVIIRTGTKGRNTVELMHEVLQRTVGTTGLSGLHQISEKELMQIKGIGEVKAIQLKCIGEISRRMAKSVARERLNFSSPDTIAEYYMEDLRHARQEKMLVAFLDSKNGLIDDLVISVGTVNASVISPREIFLEALQRHAVHIVVLHNHPSGDPTPSRQDILLTRRIKESGAMIGIDLLDHIIIGDNKYISLHEQKMLS